MAYCGKCNKHNVVFQRVSEGIYCSGCDEIEWDSERERDNVEITLRAVKKGKHEGWIKYPNDNFGEDIDEVIARYEKKLKEIKL